MGACPGARLRRPSALWRHADCAHPIGEITARTHRAPVRLTVQLDRLHPRHRASDGQEIPTPAIVLADLEQRACRSIGRYAFRLLLLAPAGGTLASLMLLRGSGPRHPLFSRFVGLAATTLVLVATVGTYDRAGLREPALYRAAGRGA